MGLPQADVVDARASGPGVVAWPGGVVAAAAGSRHQPGQRALCVVACGGAAQGRAVSVPAGAGGLCGVGVDGPGRVGAARGAHRGRRPDARLGRGGGAGLDWRQCCGDGQCKFDGAFAAVGGVAAGVPAAPVAGGVGGV